ncbi:DNA ligase, partial [Bradyrhizobium sp. BR2003]|nr:DNA ligase [Bradyrhizobium sp. BR2003]
MSRTSTLPKRLQPMLATLIDAAFDDPGWVFEDKF